MKSRIFRATAGVTVFMVAACIVVIMGMLYAYFDKKYIDELSQEAVYISQGVEKDGINYFDGFDDKTNRITWIDSDGTVIYDNIADVSTMENHSDRIEFKEALQSSVGESVRYSNTLSQKTIYYATRITDGSVLRISTTHYSVWILLLGMLQPILAVLFAAVILSAVLTNYVSKRIVQPLNLIDLEHPENVDTYDEITPLLKRISHQNKEIRKNMDELRRQREEFNTITENMSEGFIVIDNLAKILSTNQSALKIFGADNDVADKNVLELNRSESFCNAIDLALNGKHNEQIMKNGIIKPADIPHFAGNIYNEAQRLISLVGDILRLSKMDENSFSGEKVDVDLQTVVKQVSQTILQPAGDKNISVYVNTESCVIKGIPSILEEIVFNLCDNAVKYNKNGGKVDITLKKENDEAVLTVEDNGIGIPKDEQDRVFERFYRVDKSHSKEIGGTGLGLSIVKHGAAIHNAVVHIESALGKGTKIEIAFPFEK